MLSYQRTLDYLFTRLPMYQRQGIVAYKSDIKNITIAAERLGNPQENFKSIHIAGTNGKGSTAHMLASILQEAGYLTGLYTSPHLKDFRERIKINGKMIHKNDVVRFIDEKKYLFEMLDLSFFEMTVALAFDYFSRKKIDIAIIETGLGGRLDSTNILKPELGIITNISLDHTHLLGNSIQEIAKEKAGIIKEQVPIIIGRSQNDTNKIFIDEAKKKDAKIYFSNKKNNYSSDLQGRYQKENISTTITAIQELRNLGWNISSGNIKDGLKNIIQNTGLLGRWQQLAKSPLIICDVAHNEEGMKNVCDQLKRTSYNHLHFILGMVNDKNVDEILKLLPKDATYYFCKPNIPRALDQTILKATSRRFQLLGEEYNCVYHAFITAKKNAKLHDMIFISGSTFVVAEVI